jgi:hypothetical protein
LVTLWRSGATRDIHTPTWPPLHQVGFGLYVHFLFYFFPCCLSDQVWISNNSNTNIEEPEAHYFVSLLERYVAEGTQ